MVEIGLISCLVLQVGPLYAYIYSPMRLKQYNNYSTNLLPILLHSCSSISVYFLSLSVVDASKMDATGTIVLDEDMVTCLAKIATQSKRAESYRKV